MMQIGMWVLMASMPLLMHATSDQELCAQALVCYEQQEYEQAFQTYQMVQKKGSAVWYNMGNCAYKQGDCARALAYWKKAQAHGGPTDKTIAYNIDVAEKQLQANTEKTFADGFVERCLNGIATLPLGSMQIMLLLSWFVLFYIMSSYNRRKRYGMLCALLITTTVVLATVVTVKYYTMRYPAGIVVDKTVSLVAGPHALFEVVGTVEQLDRVRIYEIKDEWCKVHCNGLVGWMPIEKLLVLR